MKKNEHGFNRICQRRLVPLVDLCRCVVSGYHQACHVAVGSMPGSADEVDVAVDDGAVASVDREPPLPRHQGLAASINAVQQVIGMLPLELRERLDCRSADKVLPAQKRPSGRVRGDHVVLRSAENQYQHWHRIEDLARDGEGMALVQALVRHGISAHASNLRGIVPAVQIPARPVPKTPRNMQFRN